MSDNVCCPYLRILRCADTKEHKHFGCNPIITLSRTEQAQRLAENPLMDNDWVRAFCSAEFKDCKYFPKEG